MKVSFLVEARAGYGQGHLWRSIGLANTLATLGHDIAFLTTDYRRSKDIEEAYLHTTNVANYNKPFHQSDVVVVDMIGCTMPEVYQGKWKTCHVGFVGDKRVDGDTYRYFDLAICGGIPTENDEKLVFGFDYVLVWPEVKQLKVEDGETILSYQSVYGDLEPLGLYLKNEFANVVELPKQTNRRRDEDLARAGVVVAPWGMTVCEAMVLGKRIVSYDTFAYAVNSAMWASLNKEIVLVERKSRDFYSQVKDGILALLEKKQEPVGEKLIDGNGCSRVATMIEELVKK